MKIVAEYDISLEEIDLSYWNAPDILESMDREDEPFESVSDLIETITEGIENGDWDIDILFDNNVNCVISWSVQE